MLSCNNIKNNKEALLLKSIIQDNINKKLILPDSISVYNPFSNNINDSLSVSNSEFKIYIRLNTSCGSCITEINFWNTLSEDFKKYNTPIIFICRSDDKFELIKYLCESGKIDKFPYPFFFDEKDEFYKLNGFMKKSDHFETVLTDKNNRILLMGNPLHSKRIKELYLKEIQKK
jgi:hypothetical protein